MYLKNIMTNSLDQSLPDSAIPATIQEQAKVTFNNKNKKDRYRKIVMWSFLRKVSKFVSFHINHINCTNGIITVFSIFTGK